MELSVIESRKEKRDATVKKTIKKYDKHHDGKNLEYRIENESTKEVKKWEEDENRRKNIELNRLRNSSRIFFNIRIHDEKRESYFYWKSFEPEFCDKDKENEIKRETKRKRKM